MNIQPEHMLLPLQPGPARPGQMELEAAKPVRSTSDSLLVQQQAESRLLLTTEGRERLMDGLAAPLHQTGATGKAQRALAAYRQVGDLEQRDSVSALFGIDYYA